MNSSDDAKVANRHCESRRKRSGLTVAKASVAYEENRDQSLHLKHHGKVRVAVPVGIVGSYS